MLQGVTKNNIGQCTDQGVVIIGGGTAGVATALSLAGRGISSTLLEAGPGVKKIGETLSPEALPVLKALAIAHLPEDPRHLHCHGNIYNWGDATEEKHFIYTTAEHGWHLDRSHFERALIETARQRGVTVMDRCKLLQLGKTDGGKWDLEIRTDQNLTHMTASFLVDATGRTAKVARSLGIQRKTYDTLTGVAAHFEVSAHRPIPKFTYVQAVADGWWYAAPLSTGTIVTVYMTDAELIDKNMQQLDGYWGKLKQAPHIHALFPPDYQPQSVRLQVKSAATGHLEAVYGENWLAVGDAAYSYDPVSSYGMTSALGSGYYAGNAIVDCMSGSKVALPAYHHALEKAFSGYLPLWRRQYMQEMRWPGSPFWQAHQALYLHEATKLYTEQHG
jgi:flavin-dependent dehydrogenase